MKKIFSLFAAALFASAMFAQTELVDFEQLALDSWGGSGNPVMTLDKENKTVTIEIIATPGWQWGNQAKIILSNVAEAGLDHAKLYKLSFHAEASTADCGGVTLKFFDNNQLFYTDANYLNFSAPFDFESEWLQLGEEAATETNGIIVFDFGWDPAQTVTISNLSFLEKDATEGFEAVKDGAKAQKMIENGQMVIIKNGVRYNAVGAQIQ